MRPVIELNQKSIIRFLLLEIALTSIKYFVVQGIPGGYLYNGIANIAISLVLIFFLIPSYLSAYRECKTSTVVITIIFFFVVFFQMILFPENTTAILSNLVKMIGMSLGCLISANALRDYETFYTRLARISKIIICFAIFEFFTHTFLGVTGSDAEINYDMSFGFFLVVPTVIQFSEICRDKEGKICDCFFFMIGSLMALMMGSRGAVLAIFIGCVLSFYEENKLRKVKDFFIAMVSILGASVIFLNLKFIGTFMYKTLLSYGINSRLLLMIAYGGLTNVANRDVLQNDVMYLISQHPIIGSGIFSNLSSHSIVYEVVLFFGYPMGILILAVLVYEILKVFFCESYYKRKIMAVFISYALVDSLLNLTVLGKDMFWIYLGLAFSTKLQRRIDVKEI